jgi:hypothetical protein
MQHTNRETKYPKCFALYFQFNFLLFTTRLRQAQADNLQLFNFQIKYGESYFLSGTDDFLPAAGAFQNTFLRST